MVIGRSGRACRGVEDRVGDGGGHADEADLADALDPDRLNRSGSPTKMTSWSGMSALTGTR